MSRVLGIDPGTLNMGVGIIDSDGSNLKMVYTGVITPKKRDQIHIRLGYIHTELTALVSKYKPDEIAVESPFVATNVRTAIAIGQAQAVAMIVSAHHNLPLYCYPPTEVKQSVTNYGHASKDQVSEMVYVLLDADVSTESFDASDALAVAICHINVTEFNDLQIRT